MADKFLNSTEVQVYPSAYRGKVDGDKVFNPESRIPSEFNITTAVNRLTKKEGFVLSWENNELICSIHGYYFKLTLSNDTLSEFTNEIWAYIDLIDRNTTVESGNIDYPDTSLAPLLDGVTQGLDIEQESVYKFVGIKLTDSEPINYNYKVKILEYDSEWNIPPASKLVYSTNEIQDGVTSNSINNKFTTKSIEVTGSKTDVVLPDKSINTNEIDDLAITTAKIKDGAVTRLKLSPEIIPLILDLVYPIGSIYMTTDENFSPALNFGGQWLSINAGQYLISAGRGIGGNYTPGVTGGASSYTFTINNTNLPAHTHSYDITTNEKNMSIGGFSFSGTTSEVNLSHKHEWDLPYYAYGLVGSGDMAIALPYGAPYLQTYFTTSSLGTHSHTFSGTTGSKSYNVGGQKATGFTGTNLTTNDPITIPTMPPYYPVYMWQRIL